MDPEHELQRVLRDERLDVPVRTGAEWSMVAAARRRRHRNAALAAGAVALLAVLGTGGGIAVVQMGSEEPAPRPSPPVIQNPTHAPNPPHGTQRPDPQGGQSPGTPPQWIPPGGTGGGDRTEQPRRTEEPDPRRTSESPEPSILRRPVETAPSESEQETAPPDGDATAPNSPSDSEPEKQQETSPQETAPQAPSGGSGSGTGQQNTPGG